MQTILQYKNLKVTIHHKGAELVQLQKDNFNYIWEIEEKYWNKTSPVLFPIVGSLKNNNYLYKGKSYSLSRHGFARDYEFEVLEKSENKVVFSFSNNEETLKIYPFLFEFQISYTLTSNNLEIEYLIKNLSNEKMPFSLGAHPAFKIENNFEEYSLEFDTNDNLTTYHLENELLSGKTSKIQLTNKQLPLHYDLFKNDAIILKNHPTNSLKLLKNNQLILKLNFQDFPYLGIWTKKDAPFICLEPWLGIADSVTSNGNILEKEGIQILEENGVFVRRIGVEVG